MTLTELFAALLPYLVQIGQYLVALIAGQQQQATSSFAQQVANEQIARDQQTYDVLQQIRDDIAQERFVLENEIALCQQSGQPVTLPSPPTGYGGGASASDVWEYVSPFVGEDAQTMFSELWHWLKNVALSIDPAGNSPFAILRFPANYTLTNYAGGAVAGFKADLSVVSAGDTLRTWLAPQNPTWTFIGPTDGQLKCTPPFPYYAGFPYFVAWSEPFFELMKRIQLGTLVPHVEVPPVWPGLAGVTLGSPVALSPTCVVTGPMHGVIIDITSAAPRQVYQVFGGMQGYRFVGGLQFVDDNGEAERIQSIGMQHEVIVCKSMKEAASCSIRTDSAVTGTATPFVIG